MNFNQQLREICRKQNSLVCVGLDSELSKIPSFLLKTNDPIFEFNKAIIEATCDFVAAYKPNLAFYEAHGVRGIQSLEKTLKYIPSGIIKLADAKRGDIGNTAKLYAEAFFNHFGFDALTVNPYLGFDSVAPFLADETKGVFILCLTSNPGSRDFQYFTDGQQRLYQQVAEKVNAWNTKGNCGLVVGATHPDELKQLRELTPNLPFLIPGIGAQGGDLEASVRCGTDARGEMALFNSSRGILFKSAKNDFATVARQEASNLRDWINQVREVVEKNMG